MLNGVMTAHAERPHPAKGHVATAARHAGGHEPSPPRSELLPVCPFLLSEGHWRSAEPAREHRCTAVEPPAPLGLDKQRRLCLDALHLDCPTYIAARTAHAVRVGGSREGSGRFVRTAPTILERPRSTLALPDRIDARRGGQAGLVILMIAAVGAIIFARLPTDGQHGSGAGATPSPTVVSTPLPTSPGPTVTVPPSPVAASATPQPTGSAGPSASPSGTGQAPQTYRVKAGDTLLKIAAQYRTTVAAIQQLNGLKDPRIIRVGQILKIPPVGG